MSGAPAAAYPFSGDILVCAPHMDDEALGCGMLIALHAARAQVHVLFASDGAGSPEAPRDRPGAAGELRPVRAAEAVEALGVLGVPRPNITFLGLPDGSLSRRRHALAQHVAELAREVRAACVFVPFRYDRHPDHLALNRAVTAARLDGRIVADIVEYFVYAKWRMLKTGDVRDYLRAEDTIRVRCERAARRKRAALACHRSQTTLFFPGQRRAILTQALIDRACEEPEVFLRHRADRPGRHGLARGRHWVPVACRLERVLKRCKDWATGERVR
jgi:LmbE family N-acetylglucosaminyl deacetylase